MNKFTIFTVLLTVAVVLAVTDLVVSGSDGEDLQADVLNVVEVVEQPNVAELPNEVITEKPATNTNSLYIDPFEDLELTSGTKATIPSFAIDATLLTQAGLSNASVKQRGFNGLVFGFLDLVDSDKTEVRHIDVFEGDDYVMTIYEMIPKTGTEVAASTIYDDLKSFGMIVDFGDINETKDKQFYFNHNEQTRTAHLTVQLDGKVYGFQYPKDRHPVVTNLIGSL